MLPTRNSMAMRGAADDVQRLMPAYSPSRATAAPGDAPQPIWHALSGQEPEFRRTLAHLATRFASVDAERIGGLVVDSLREIALILRADRAFIWAQPADDARATTFDWTHPSLDAGSEPLDLA